MAAAKIKAFASKAYVVARPMTMAQFTKLHGVEALESISAKDKGFEIIHDYQEETQRSEWVEAHTFSALFEELGELTTDKQLSVISYQFRAGIYSDESLNLVRKPFERLARLMEELPDSDQKYIGFQKLLEAADCFTRSLPKQS